MRIVKKINDYDLSQEQELFLKALEAKGIFTGCSETIVNPDFVEEYIRPTNDFTIYTNSFPGAEAKRIIRKEKPSA